MNLISDPWIPIRRASGKQERIAPWQVTERHDSDPVVALNAPRPDFNGALIQFLIGLVQVACPPKKADDSDWIDWLEEPPSPEILKSSFSEYQAAFNLDGDGPKFMQDFSSLDVKGSESIAALLIDAPGGNTLKNNADHFIKRGGVSCMCDSCAATALFTLQTNAPSGGAGHRTSLRGGGPLTTLIALDPVAEQLDETLWRSIWLNILNRNSYSRLSGNHERDDVADIFPWMVPTRTSEKNGLDTYPQDVNPLQMYWGMPRRIRLDWENVSSGECEVCGESAERLISHYVTKNYGVNYNGAWQHPLSPHRIDAKSGEPIPLHPQTGGFSYRHWLSWANGNDQNRAATVISEFSLQNRKALGSQLRLSVSGYDMDNMKARCWYESTVPLYTVSTDKRELFSQRVDALIKGAEEISSFVRSCVKEAWFKRPGDAKGDTTFLSDAFFNHTEKSFYASLNRLAQELEQGADGLAVLADWHSILRKAAITLFDHWVVQESVENANPRRIAEAHQKLINLIHSKKIQKILPFNSKEKAA